MCQLITTVAGNGTAGNTGDGGQATSAQLSAPYDLGVDGAGNVYIAGESCECIRKVAPGGTITTWRARPVFTDLVETTDRQQVLSSKAPSDWE